MAYLEELLPEFRNGAKIRLKEWDKDFYIHIKFSSCRDEKGHSFDFCANDFISKNWELYKEPELDWQKIIDNKFPCWFWDSFGNYKRLDFLAYIKEGSSSPFFASSTSAGYPFCRPVRRDEVTFYEDKKDE